MDSESWSHITGSTPMDKEEEEFHSATDLSHGPLSGDQTSNSMLIKWYDAESENPKNKAQAGHELYKPMSKMPPNKRKFLEGQHNAAEDEA